jgi:phage N-6-adenine-methyltransferase
MLVKILIDDEFKNLIPPLTDEEYKGLEDSIVKEGCRDALILWGNTLIDGHNRYEICTKHNIPFKTVEHNFDSRQAVIEWIILNQFGRRNLPAHERARLALRLKPVIAERAKENQGKRNDLTFSKNLEEVKQIYTDDKIAKTAGVSTETIRKVETIEHKAPEPVVMASRKGDISVNSAYEVTKLEPQEQKEIAHRIEHIAEEPKETSTPKAIVQEVLKRPHVANNSGNNEWYTPAEFIEAAVDVMGCIDLDPASNPIANKVVKADKYYTAEDNGLDKTWSGNVWLNPPYASDLIGKFADKLISERENYTQAIVLVNNATETEWFNKIVSIASAVCFPKSRVKFYMPDGKTGAPLQGQAVLYIGENTNKFTDVFCKLGWCCNVIH